MMDLTWQKLVVVLAGGALGSVLRFFSSAWIQQWTGSSYPFGTTAVNLLGSLIFGVVWGLTEQRGTISPVLYLFLISGLMGAFTTFSTMMFETARLFESGRAGMAFLNVGVQNILGVMLVFLGIAIGRYAS